MDTSETIPYLSQDRLASLGITTSEVVESIESLLARLDSKTAWSAPKAAFLTDDGRYMMAALAAADDPPLLAVKTIVLNPRNPERGLPQINGLVTMLDSSSGIPVAILDGNWITEVRTAGLSATAAKRMAREDSKVAAFIGCGVQARSHLKAFCELFSLEEVRLFGRGQANIERLSGEARDRFLGVTICDSGEEALRGADLIVSSVTYSDNQEPFLDADWLKPGAFAAITDLGAPWKKESFGFLDQVVIDDHEQEAALPNKLASAEHITGDLSELVMGRVAGRTSSEQRNAFIFRGHAIGDLALSILAYQRSSNGSG